MIRRPPRSTQSRSSAASDVYKRQPYGRAVGIFKSDLALGAGGVEQKRDDGVLADVFGDVLLRVIRPHLFLVDVFLIFEKYINQKQMGAYYTKEDITE